MENREPTEVIKHSASIQITNKINLLQRQAWNIVPSFIVFYGIMLLVYKNKILSELSSMGELQHPLSHNH